MTKSYWKRSDLFLKEKMIFLNETIESWNEKLYLQRSKAMQFQWHNHTFNKASYFWAKSRKSHLWMNKSYVRRKNKSIYIYIYIYHHIFVYLHTYIYIYTYNILTHMTFEVHFKEQHYFFHIFSGEWKIVGGSISLQPGPRALVLVAKKGCAGGRQLSGKQMSVEEGVE